MPFLRVGSRALIVSLVGLALVQATPSLGATPFVHQTVDAAGNVGSVYTSLAVDAQGNPRISYYDASNFDLKYASKIGAVWTLETVDAPGSVGSGSSLALDAQGNPSISYLDATSGNLKYARKIGGVWTLETVDAVGSVGLLTSLALDAQGNPRISYYDDTNDDLKLASKNGVVWTREIVDATGDVGSISSLALDAQGNPRISYFDQTNSDLKFASKSGGVWTLETVDANGAVGSFNSLAQDGQGNPCISYYDGTNSDLKYTDAAVHVVEPLGGETWPVGSLRSIRWSGVGPVNVFLSVDGGQTFDLLREGLISNVWEFRVPHAPTRFASLRVHRASPLSTAETESLLTIESAIELLSLKAEPVGGAGGVVLSWNTHPGPEDLEGYKIERQEGLGWRTVVDLTREITYTDPVGNWGDRYRLFGVNGWGEELLLGETRFGVARPLAAWPLPYRGGNLDVSFATYGGHTGFAEVALYDLQGRLVRTIAQGTYPAGLQNSRWDGSDDTGRPVAAGVYFLRAVSAGESTELKLVVVR